MYELNIKPKDWLLILVTGVVFASLLSMLVYQILDRGYISGLVFGALIGFLISFYSLIFITFMNKKVLPSLEQRYWNVVAALFSFLSGFFGFLSAVVLSKILSIELLDVIAEQLYSIAFIVGVLTYVMGLVIYSFVNIRNQKERRDYEYVQSRLRSLETQLNPHFIFNALNSIAELIHQDKNKAENAILKMSTFLRSSMNEKALIPLADELKNIQGYLELENIRFSEQLHLDIASNIPKWSIPKFSLQLLVENAIKHGYDAKPLHIKITFDQDENSIVVSNDGKPITSRVFGVGLNNLKQRLELLCRGELMIVDPKKSEFKILLGKCYENTDS
ncbi:MAG: histidine kinase [Sulfurimonas sp.]